MKGKESVLKGSVGERTALLRLWTFELALTVDSVANKTIILKILTMRFCIKLFPRLPIKGSKFSFPSENNFCGITVKLNTIFFSFEKMEEQFWDKIKVKGSSKVKNKSVVIVSKDRNTNWGKWRLRLESLSLTRSLATSICFFLGTHSTRSISPNVITANVTEKIFQVHLGKLSSR